MNFAVVIWSNNNISGFLQSDGQLGIRRCIRLVGFIVWSYYHDDEISPACGELQLNTVCTVVVEASRCCPTGPKNVV